MSELLYAPHLNTQLTRTANSNQDDLNGDEYDGKDECWLVFSYLSKHTSDKVPIAICPTDYATAGVLVDDVRGSSVDPFKVANLHSGTARSAS